MADDREEEDELTAFESKLVGVLALLLVQGRKQPDQIDLLDRAGFRPAEIAPLIGTTPNSVRATLSVLNRARKKAPRAPRKAK